jgi:hypothetical protein
MPIRTLIFNETSPSSATTVASSQAVQGSDLSVASGVAGIGLDDYDTIDVYAQLQGATGGTLDVYLQVGVDQGGGTWVDAIHFPQLANGAAAVQYKCSLTQRAQATTDNPIVVGSGLSPALAANTIVQGVAFDRARLVFKSGASTSAGATQKVWLVGHRTRIRETGA